MKVRVKIPDDVTLERKGETIEVSGPEGELEREFHHPMVEMETEGDEIVISARRDRRRVNALVGTWRAHLENMLTGVTEGYERRMKVVHVHFPMNARVEGGEVLVENYLGQQAPRKARIEEGVEVDVQDGELTVRGPDKEKVGQTVANIELATRSTNQRDPRRFYDGVYEVEE